MSSKPSSASCEQPKHGCSMCLALLGSNLRCKQSDNVRSCTALWRFFLHGIKRKNAKKCAGLLRIRVYHIFQSLSARPQEALRWIQRLSIHLGWEQNEPCHLSWINGILRALWCYVKGKSPSINLWGRAGMEPKRSSGQWSWTRGRTLWPWVVIMLHFLVCCFLGGSGKIHKTLPCFSCNLKGLQENALLCPTCNVKKYQVLGVKSKGWNRISGYPIPWIPGCPSHGAVKSAG